LFIHQGCTDRDIIDVKEGVALPVVTNLSLSAGADKNVTLTWGIPAAIPESIKQPLSVLIEVREVIGPMRTTTVLSTHLANAPTEFVYTLPDETKTYHFTVKLNGGLKVADPNYSSNIYSLGETVSYTR